MPTKNEGNMAEQMVQEVNGCQITLYFVESEKSNIMDEIRGILTSSYEERVYTQSQEVSN